MKKLLALFVGLALIVGCAARQNLVISDNQTSVPYFETVYYGELQSCEVDEYITYMGRCSKTLQVYPEKDMYWVTEENTNGDDVSVTMVWDIPNTLVIGTCFYLEATQEENCGVLEFENADGKSKFINEFDKSGIINAISLPELKGTLADQIAKTADLSVDDDCDYCEWIKNQMEME